jgi:hypothetical protein
MKSSVLALGSLWIATMSIFAQLTAGQNHSITFTDIDGNSFSTAEGRITTVVLTSKANVDRAHALGDRIPDHCLGNSLYRMVTVVSFESKHSGPIRAFLTSMIRRRVDSESKQLQVRYEKLKIERNARHDIFAVADFDGAIAEKLGAKPGATLFHVFVFGKKGELLKQWNELPSADELAAALKEN